MRIIDAHQHIGGTATIPYPLPMVSADEAHAPWLAATVHVECRMAYRPDGPPEMRPVGETEAIVESTTASQAATGVCRAAAIIGYADLTLGANIDRVLDGHMAAGGHRFRGIRMMATWHDDIKIHPRVRNLNPALLTDQQVRAGAKVLGARGLSLDVWAYHIQLEEVRDFARANPDLLIVLDHCGTPLCSDGDPPRREETFAAWRAGMKRLASCANVLVKLSGLRMPITGLAGHPEEMRRYLLAAIDLFEPERCMFASNFPVDRFAVGFRELWQWFDMIVADFGPAERDAMFFGTAAKAYRIK